MRDAALNRTNFMIPRDAVVLLQSLHAIIKTALRRMNFVMVKQTALTTVTSQMSVAVSRSTLSTISNAVGVIQLPNSHVLAVIASPSLKDAMELPNVQTNRTRRTAALAVIHTTTVKSADAIPRANGLAKTEIAYLKPISATVRLSAPTNRMKEMSPVALKITLLSITKNSVAVIQILNSLARVDSVSIRTRCAMAPLNA